MVRPTAQAHTGDKRQPRQLLLARGVPPRPYTSTGNSAVPPSGELEAIIDFCMWPPAYELRALGEVKVPRDQRELKQRFEAGRRILAICRAKP